MTWLFWALLSAFFAALTAVLAKVGVESVEPNFATAVRTSVIFVFVWFVALLFSQSTNSFHFPSKRALLFLVLSGIATALSWLCYFRALQLGPASRVAPVDKLSVVLVIILATLFLGEKLTWGKGLGGLLIAAGAIAITFG